MYKISKNSSPLYNCRWVTMILFHLDPELYEPHCRKEECFESLDKIKKSILNFKYPYLRRNRELKSIAKMTHDRDQLSIRSGKNFILFRTQVSYLDFKPFEHTL